MELYNLEKLIKIRVVDKIESDIYDWCPYHKYWFGWVTREGVYTWDNKYIFQMPVNHFVENGIVYECPECKLFFEDKFTYSCKFRNIEDANAKAFEIDKLFWERTGNHLIEL